MPMDFRNEETLKPYKKAMMGARAVISAAELEKQVNGMLGNQLIKGLRLHTADSRYCLPSYSGAKTIIRKSRMSEMANPAGSAMRGQSFDCDDFALVLKARFAYAAYRDPANYQNCPYCFGIVWGMLPFPFPHSMNWMITDDGAFYFVEPQREEIIPIEQCRNYRYINFMMV